MNTYPSLDAYRPWLDFSFPEESASDISLFSAAVRSLGWPSSPSSVPAAPRDLLLALGVQPGDYVVLPNLCPLYWAAAVRALGAEVILIDHHPEHWQMDLDLLEEFLMNFSMLNEADNLILKKDQRVIRAIVVPHLLGGLCDLERLAFIAFRFHLRLAEDISQAMGSRWKERPAGSFGHLNYCRFTGNPLLPFGRAVAFSGETTWVDGLPPQDAPAPPLHELADRLGRQLLSRLPEVLEGFRRTEHYYRQTLGPGQIRWMLLPSECTGSGLATGIRPGEKGWPTDQAPSGRLAPPLYRQPPFGEVLYIRREDWSDRLFREARLLPVRWTVTEDVELAGAMIKS